MDKSFFILMSVLGVLCVGCAQKNDSSGSVGASNRSVASISSSQASFIPSVASWCDGVMQNPEATPEAKKVFNLVLKLSCRQSGVLSGQNAGHGNQILESNNIMGYQKSVQVLIDRDSVTPSILGIDYEHDKIFTSAQLSEANQKLIEHANKGGYITINWAPLSPWVNDGRDVINNPGDWLATRTTVNNPNGKATYINLMELVTPGTDMYAIWREKLDRIAIALDELQDAGVPVLWRPMQEMSGTHFWWGSETSSEGYVALWRDLYRYFTDEKSSII